MPAQMVATSPKSAQRRAQCAEPLHRTLMCIGWAAGCKPPIPPTIPTGYSNGAGKLSLPAPLIGHKTVSSGRAAEHHVVKEDDQRSSDYSDDELNDEATRATTATQAAQHRYMTDDKSTNEAAHDPE